MTTKKPRPAPRKRIELEETDLTPFQILQIPVRTEADRDRRLAAMRAITGSAAPRWSRGLDHDQIMDMYKVPK